MRGEELGASLKKKEAAPAAAAAVAEGSAVQKGGRKAAEVGCTINQSNGMAPEASLGTGRAKEIDAPEAETTAGLVCHLRHCALARALQLYMLLSSGASSLVWSLFKLVAASATAAATGVIIIG